MRQVLLALTATLLLSALAPSAHAATGLGIPANTPTLFALNADRGTLTPAARKGQFILTLSQLDRRGVWFTDKPSRRSGTVRPATLFSSWKTLGFVQDRPNAVVTLPGGRDGADTVAFELGRPRYSARTRTVRFTVSTLSSLSPGLAHHGPQVDDRIPRRFGEAALFIDDGQDDGGVGRGGDCYVGGIVLMATPRRVTNVFPADGSTLSIAFNPGLYSVLGTTFGAAPAGTFRLPRLTTPAGMAYGVCQFGAYPLDASSGPDLQCSNGALALFLRQPASNWIARADIPSPAPGLEWYRCASGTPVGEDQYGCTMGQLTPFTGALSVGYAPADGRRLAIWQSPALYALLGPAFGGDGQASFGLPTLPGPVAGTTYGICTAGFFPSFD